MRIGKRLFPYPVLNQFKELSSYKDCEFKFDYEIEQDDKEFVFKGVHIEIGKSLLSEMINDGRAKVAFVVECSYTVFRRVYDITTEPTDIHIPVSSFRDKIEVSAFAYAAQDLVLSGDDFLDAYTGYEFEVDKYDILAIDDGFMVKVEMDESKDNKVSSIFTIIKSSDAEAKSILIKSLDRKINIILPQEKYESYESLKNVELYKNIFFTTIAIPALVKYFEQFKMRGELNGVRLNDIVMEYGWFASVMNMYQKIHGCELTDHKFQCISSEELAQELFDYAPIKAIDDMESILNKSNEEDDDYE